MVIGMSSDEANSSDYRGTDEGNKLKSSSGWIENGNGTDEFGFNAIPAGQRATSAGDFSNINEVTTFWTSSSSSSNGWFRRMYYNQSSIFRLYYDPDRGYSIRCIKD